MREGERVKSNINFRSRLESNCDYLLLPYILYTSWPPYSYQNSHLEFKIQCIFNYFWKLFPLTKFYLLFFLRISVNNFIKALEKYIGLTGLDFSFSRPSSLKSVFSHLFPMGWHLDIQYVSGFIIVTDNSYIAVFIKFWEKHIFIAKYLFRKVSLVAQLVKNPPAMQETLVWFLDWEDLLEEGMATYSRVSWPGEFHGQRSLDGYSSWGHRESALAWWSYECLVICRWMYKRIGVCWLQQLYYGHSSPRTLPLWRISAILEPMPVILVMSTS